MIWVSGNDGNDDNNDSRLYQKLTMIAVLVSCHDGDDDDDYLSDDDDVDNDDNDDDGSRENSDIDNDDNEVYSGDDDNDDVTDVFLIYKFIVLYHIFVCFYRETKNMSTLYFI